MKVRTVVSIVSISIFFVATAGAQVTVNPDGSANLQNGGTSPKTPVGQTDLTNKSYVDTMNLVERGSVTMTAGGIVLSGKIYWEKYPDGKLHQHGWLTVNPADDSNAVGTFPTFTWPVAPISDDGLNAMAVYGGRRLDSIAPTGPTDPQLTSVSAYSTGIRFVNPGTGNVRDGFALFSYKANADTIGSAERLIFLFSMEGFYK